MTSYGIYHKYCEKLSQFVKEVCQGRPDDHGFKHMQEVAQNCHKHRYECIEKNLDTHLKLMTVAWLHDVADHKFTKNNPDLKVKLENFLKEIRPDDYQIISSIIDDISFSKENQLYKSGVLKFEPDDMEADRYWIEKYGKENARIRNIVSDEDKLLALGKTGVKRCIEYNLQRIETEIEEKYQKNDKEEKDKKEEAKSITDILKEDIYKHCQEKLFILPKFMRTKSGKLRSVELLKEFQEELLIQFPEKNKS